MERFEEAAKSLKKSMKGIGTDESRLIKEIVNHTNSERQSIKEIYLTMYGKTLEESIKSEISGNFLEGVLALLEPVDKYEAKCLRKSLKAINTNEKILIQTICPKEAFEIENLKMIYNTTYERNLEKDIEAECKGYFGRILRSLVSCGR
ncbi:annexin A7 isoform X1, partial [Brachionus plicatilis]